MKTIDRKIDVVRNHIVGPYIGSTALFHYYYQFHFKIYYKNRVRKNIFSSGKKLFSMAALQFFTHFCGFTPFQLIIMLSKIKNFVLYKRTRKNLILFSMFIVQ